MKHEQYLGHLSDIFAKQYYVCVSIVEYRRTSNY